MVGAATLFLLPAVLGLVVLRVLPMVQAFSDAFVRADGSWTVDIMIRTLTDPVFQSSLRLTILFVLIINPAQILMALALAVLLTKHVPLVGFWRTILILPVAVPQVVSAVIWQVLLRPDGPLNGLAARLGLPEVPWLVSPDYALFSIMVVCSWIGVGYWMVFLIAGMQEVPRSLYEAAEIDGASGMRKFWSVTIPGIRRQILFVLVANTASNFLIYAPVRVLTQGGPSESTNLLMYNIAETAFTFGDLQAASAGTIILAAIVLVVVAIQFKMLPGEDD